MKVEVNETQTASEKGKYPYLAKFVSDIGEYIVLFSEENTGVIVFDNYNNIGQFSSDFAEEKFTPFTGSITLSND